MLHYDPAELVLIEGQLGKWQAAPHEQHAIHALHQFCAPRLCSELPGYHFEIAGGARTVMDALGVLNLQGFGLVHTQDMHEAARAVEAGLWTPEPLPYAAMPQRFGFVPSPQGAWALSGHR